MNEIKGKERIIFPLDVSSKEEALIWVERLKDLVGIFKIGFELFTSCGPQIVEEVRNKGAKKVFLDLKLYDIPKVISNTVKIISNLEIDWVTVHTLSGFEALKRAVESAYNNLKIIGVTILTSLDRADLMELGFNSELVRDTKKIVLKLANLGYKAGCDGVVCSAKEVELIKENYPSLLTIVPGVRFEETIKGDDQLRTATPYEIVLNGGDYLVIGRPIREAEKPEEFCKKIIKEIEKAEREKRGKTNDS